MVKAVLHAPEATLNAINVSDVGMESFSSRANFLIQSADCISREACPRLKLSEWKLVVNSAKLTVWSYEQGPIYVLGSMVRKIAESTDAEAYGVDLQALSMRLNKCTFTQLFAMFEVVHRFWNFKPELVVPGEEFGEKVERFGGRVDYDE